MVPIYFKEESCKIKYRRKFNGKLYTQGGDGKKTLLSKTEATKLANEARKMGKNARIVPQCGKYLVYTRPKGK